MREMNTKSFEEEFQIVKVLSRCFKLCNKTGEMGIVAGAVSGVEDGRSATGGVESS